MVSVNKKLKCSNSYCDHVLTYKEWNKLLIEQKSSDIPSDKIVPIPDQVICPVCGREQDIDELINNYSNDTH